MYVYSILSYMAVNYFCTMQRFEDIVTDSSSDTSGTEFLDENSNVSIMFGLKFW